MTTASASPCGELYAALSLSLGEKQIRILDLDPRRFSRQISGTLRLSNASAGPDDVPIYEALSYTWGAPEKPCSILLNGKHQMPITRNLWGALRRLRNITGSRSLWVDAICIDQANVPERSAQVALMGWVYTQATCVNVWLGEPRSRAVLHLASSLVFSHIKATFLCESPNLRVWRRGGLSRAADLHRAFAMGSALKNGSHWSTRLWTLQEYVLAKQVRFCWGSRCADYTESANTFFPVIGYKDKSFDPFSDVWLTRTWRSYAQFSRDVKKSRAQLRGLYWSEGCADLARAMANVFRVQASDPRDAVYGILGLLNDRDACRIQVDYTLPLTEVYARATHAIIQSTGSVSVLMAAQPWYDAAQDRHDGTRVLPSWSFHFGSKNLQRWLRRQSDWIWHIDDRSPLSSAADGIQLGHDARWIKLPVCGLDRVLKVWIVTEPLQQFSALSGMIRRLLSTAGKLWSARKADPVRNGITLPKERDKDENTDWFLLDEACELWRSYILSGNVEDAGWTCTGREERIFDMLSHIRKIDTDRSAGLSLFATARGRIGFGRRRVCPGDKLIVTERLETYLVLRELRPPGPAQQWALESSCPSKVQHVLVGPAYVFGPALDGPSEGDNASMDKILEHFYVI